MSAKPMCCRTVAIVCAIAAFNSVALASGTSDNLPIAEIDALYALYHATQGEHWHWFHFARSGIPWEFSATCNPCAEHWQGVNCTAATATDGYLHVTELGLERHNLHGTIPIQLFNLSQLQILYLQENYLSGTIPKVIADLHALVQLDLDSNLLSGTIPTELANSQVIHEMVLYDNYLTGTISSQFGDTQTLSVFLLYNNYLTGSIPPELGDLDPTVFQQLDLTINDLTGSIPLSLGNLVTMNYLSIDTNYLTGTIPPQLGYLTELNYLNLLNNMLVGTLPVELGNLQQLLQLDVSSALLTGSVPASIGTLKHLTFLGLNSNMFTSTLPVGINHMRNLTTLFLYNNMFSGPIASFINSSAQPALGVVQLQSNRFTGPMPADLFALPQLLTVVLGDNCFSGSLPADICSAVQVTTLSMDGLHSAHSCRHALFPGVLKAFVLTDYIQDGIPTCLFEMPKLNTLHLSGNGLLGSLPDNVSISPNLVDMALSYNHLTGSIPAVFQDRIWYNLDQSYNQLAGTLSDKFATVPGNLSMMAELGITVVNGTQDEYNNPYGATVLRNNRLSKGIPTVFDSMRNVSILQGNLYGCALDQHDLPQHDSGRPTYSCGSNAFNVPYYLYLSLLFAGLCVAVAVHHWRHLWHTSSVSVNVRTALQSMSMWATVVEQYEAQAASGQPRPLQRYKHVQQLFDSLCQQAAWCALYIVFVGIPLYATLSHYHSTHTEAYAWSIAAAYMSGPTAMGLQMVLLCVLLGLLIALYTLLLRTVASSGQQQVQHLQDDGAPAVIEFDSTLLRRVGIYSALFFVNSIVVAGANIGFVLAATNGNALAQAFAQIALSVFKLLWSNFGLTYLMRWTQQHLTALDTPSGENASAPPHAFFGLQLFVQLYNLIIVPCGVTVLLSADCFNSAIVAAPSVDTHFAYKSCGLLVGSRNICLYYTTRFVSSSYDPPFTYSYQCSSSLITYYAPTFVYTGLIATFVNPVLSWAQRTVYVRVPEQSRWKPFVRQIIPKIQRPSGAAAVQFDRPYNPLRPYWDANHRCILLLTYLGVMLTFGLVFPPLALVMLTTMYSSVWLWRIEVGRFLCEALADNVHKYSELINAECESVGSVPRLQQAARVLLWVVCAFYAPFMFDTLGDAQGARRSFWVLIVTPLLPAVIRMVAYCSPQWSSALHSSRNNEASNSVAASMELHSLNPNSETPTKTETDTEGAKNDDVSVLSVLHQP